MPMVREIHCRYCDRRHGDLSEPHDYVPDDTAPSINGRRPCIWCGRGRGSYLHPKEEKERG